jgi:hypothetical protein
MATRVLVPVVLGCLGCVYLPFLISPWICPPVVLIFLFDVGEAAYGSSIPPAAPRFRVDCVVFGVGLAVCTASLSLVSVLISGQKASSFRHVVDLSTSGAGSQLF